MREGLVYMEIKTNSNYLPTNYNRTLMKNNLGMRQYETYNFKSDSCMQIILYCE